VDLVGEEEEGRRERRLWVKDMKVEDLAAKSVSQPREIQLKLPVPEGPKDTTPGRGGGVWGIVGVSKKGFESRG
jgi:hypothetical protein